jgi:hypothetical protein
LAHHASSGIDPDTRTTNSKEYNAALKARGSLLVWPDNLEEVDWLSSAQPRRNQNALLQAA